MKQTDYIWYRFKSKCPTQAMEVFVRRLAMELNVPATQIVLTLMQAK